MAKEILGVDDSASIRHVVGITLRGADRYSGTIGIFSK